VIPRAEKIRFHSSGTEATQIGSNASRLLNREKSIYSDTFKTYLVSATTGIEP